MKNILPGCILLLLLLYRVSLNGQGPYYFKHYQVENGLSHNKVKAIEMDKKGFMWFGTIDGLNRFDGYNFRIFRKDAADSNALKDHTIVSLLADRESLWVGTDGGLYQFDLSHEIFKLLHFSEHKIVKAVKKDLENNLWLILNTSLYRYNIKTARLTCFDDQGIDASSLCIPEDGTVFVATTAGKLHKFLPETNRFLNYTVFNSTEKLCSDSKTIEKIYATRSGMILIATANGKVKAFDVKSNVCKDIFVENPNGTKVYGLDFIHYGGDEYWLASETGIVTFNLKTGNYSHIQMEYDNPFSLSDNTVYALYKDQEGGVWAGTKLGGINYYPFPYNQFIKYYSMARPNTLKGNGVHEICPDNYGNLWIGTEQDGLNKLNTQSGVFTHFKPGKKKGSISFSSIHGLLADGSNLWIGTLYNGLDKMDIKSGKVIKHYTVESHLARSNFIIALIKTTFDDIYAGTAYNVYKYDKSTDSFFVVPGLHFLSNSIKEIAPGILSICTLGDGVYIYDTQRSKIVQNLRHDPKNPNSLSDDKVHGQLKDSRGIYWYATREGLCKYEPEKNKFTRYTRENGLTSNFVLSILEDKKYNLWISSTNGLLCFNPSTAGVKVFTTANGLVNNQFNINSAYKDSTGTMYFGSDKGLVRFNPDNFMVNRFVPPVCITGFQVNNTELQLRHDNSSLKKSVTFLDKILLTHDQSSVSLDFAALSYTSPESNEYAYFLEGLEKEWTYLKSNRKVYFTRLPAGRYTFRVKGANSSGVWNNRETVLTIKVLPPFWASNLAYVIYVVLGLGIVGMAVIYQNKSTRERNKRRMERLQYEKEKELYENKMDFFTNVAHEIRTPLTLIQAPMEDIMDHADQMPAIKSTLIIMERNTSQLLELANQLLDFRQTEVKKFSLDFKAVDVAELLTSTHLNFQSLAEQHGLCYSIHIPVKTFTVMADKDAILKILNNLYSNAIKYASKVVRVGLSYNESLHNFSVEFSNDGLKIPADKKESIFEPFYRLKESLSLPGTGIGLAISRNLAELHKGSLVLQETQNELNVFRLTLPLNPNGSLD